MEQRTNKSVRKELNSGKSMVRDFIKKQKREYFDHLKA